MQRIDKIRLEECGERRKRWKIGLEAAKMVGCGKKKNLRKKDGRIGMQRIDEIRLEGCGEKKEEMEDWVGSGEESNNGRK